MLINHKYHVAKIHIKLFICHIVGDATKKSEVFRPRSHFLHSLVSAFTYGYLDISTSKYQYVTAKSMPKHQFFILHF